MKDSKKSHTPQTEDSDFPAASSDRKSYEKVVEHVKTLLGEGKLSIGDRLPTERELAATLNLGRNSTREAIRTLENLGLVESRQGSGNYVVNNFVGSLKDVLEFALLSGSIDLLSVTRFKRIIELEAVSCACANCSDAVLKGLRDAYDHLAEVITDYNLESWIYWDRTFHLRIIEMGRSSLFSMMSQSIDELYSRNFAALLLVNNEKVNRKMCDLHRTILEAIAQRNVIQGTSAVNLHYELVESFIRNNCRRDEETN